MRDSFREVPHNPPTRHTIMCGGVPKLGVSVVAGGGSVTICGHGPRVRSQLPGVSCHQSPAAADAEPVSWEHQPGLQHPTQ